MTAVGAPAAFRCLAGDGERLGVPRQQPGCLDADEVEPAGELVLQPGGERRRPVVEPAGEGRPVQPDLVAQTGRHALELDSPGCRHHVDRFAERVQSANVDQHPGGEPAECQVERLAPRLELRSHLDQLADERQVLRGEPSSLGQHRANRVQLSRDVAPASPDRFVFRSQPSQLVSGRVLLRHRLGELALGGFPGVDISQRALRRLDQCGEVLPGGHGSVDRAERPVQPLP